MLDTAQTALHGASLAAIGITVIVIVIACVRPQLFKRVFQEFSERKYIVSVAVFMALLSGTVALITEPVNEVTYVSQNNKSTIYSVNPLDAPQDNTLEEIKVEEVPTITDIPFTHQHVNDATLPKGQTKLTRAGVVGKKQTIYMVTYKDTVEQSRSVKSEAVTVQPVTQITAVGTLVAPTAPAPVTTPANPYPQASEQKAAAPQAQKNNYRLDVCRNSQSWLCKQLR